MVLTNEAWLTGRPDGTAMLSLGLKGGLRELGIKVKTSELWYRTCGPVLLCGAWPVLNLQNSPSGRALRALHDSEVAAKALGVDVVLLKLKAFVISAVMSRCRVAAGPDERFRHARGRRLPAFHELVTMAMLGGAGSVIGGIFGAGLLTALPQVLTLFQEYKHLLLGLVMMLVMIFMTEGLVPSLQRRLRGRAL